MEDRTARAAQLREGIAGAAASLPEEHAGLASSAVAAADRIVSAGEDGAGLPPDDATVERLERAHFALLRVVVLHEEPAEAGLEEAVAELERRAEGTGRPPAATASSE